jgi:predicted RNase H-like HicB family nuclease
MVNRYFINIEPDESRGVVLTIEALPHLLIFGDTPEDALRHAHEAIRFRLRDTTRGSGRPFIELVLREPGDAGQAVG